LNADEMIKETLIFNEGQLLPRMSPFHIAYGIGKKLSLRLRRFYCFSSAA
jgi:hypothetical protein